MQSRPQPAPPTDRWILRNRPARNAVDPTRPYAHFNEEEPVAPGLNAKTNAIFLTNRECPWHCVMCDLWKNTTTTPVEAGMIPSQIRFALDRLNSDATQVKLYNAGSFFDTGAIPAGDLPEIARLVSHFQRVVVECHPKLVGIQAVKFQQLLSESGPARLQVAMGLETIHPDVLPKLNKKMSTDDFARASDFLRSHDLGRRAFLLVKPPFMAEEDVLEWTRRSVEFAFGNGIEIVCLIPTRGGNGALEELQQAGVFSPPSLSLFEQAIDSSLGFGAGMVLADLWDLARFSECPHCLPARIERLKQINLFQTIAPGIPCNCQSI